MFLSLSYFFAEAKFVVVKDIQGDSIEVGVPARVIKLRGSIENNLNNRERSV